MDRPSNPFVVVDSAQEQPVRVLAVDDNSKNLAALEALLDGKGIELVMADSGDAALRHVAEQDFALILLDVRMPGQSGFEVAKVIRSRPRSSHVPIIFLTASENTERQVLEGYALGAVDFLFKPLVPEILLSKVSVFIELYRQAQNIRRQAELLRQAEHREHEHRLAEMQKSIAEERLLQEIQQERRLSAERVQAIRAREEFISIASHELRTPLTPLVLRVQALRQAAERKDFEQVIDTALKIESYAKRLSRLVDTLLDVSRVMHGRVTLDRTDVELESMLKQVVSSVESHATRAGAVISLRTPGPVHGYWDRERLELTFNNLLMNAIKYGLGKPIDVELELQAARAVVSVRDRGMGIAPEDQERVFERFERAVPMTHFGGFGLGLWMARNFVEAHDGSIHLESEPGQGTLVRVELPVAT